MIDRDIDPDMEVSARGNMVPDDLFGQVLMFHEKFLPETIAKNTSEPYCTPEKNNEMYHFRINFMEEEVGEYYRAMGLKEDGTMPDGWMSGSFEMKTDRVEELDALVDICWVAMGTALMRFGEQAFRDACMEVAKSNIVEKFKDPNKVKIQKSANWTPPDIAGVIEKNK